MQGFRIPVGSTGRGGIRRVWWGVNDSADKYIAPRGSDRTAQLDENLHEGSRAG